MGSSPLLSLSVFGPGTGESILLILRPEGQPRAVYVVDAYALRPYDSPSTNPVIAAQEGNFSWSEVKGVCLTHAHEDHFMGLLPVARQSTKCQWMGPTLIPLDSVVDLQKALAQHVEAPGSASTPARWVADSIGDLASWSKSAQPFPAFSGQTIEDDGISIRIIAPTYAAATAQVRELVADAAQRVTNEYEAPRIDLNICSVGIVVDLAVGTRVVLLGDMVAGSWRSVRHDGKLMGILAERKADIVKLPHHCSLGAMCPELLDQICDPERTRAVFTPRWLKAPPPHDEAVRRVSERVLELWCTVRLDRASKLWCRSEPGDIVGDLALQRTLGGPQKAALPPADCMVLFEVDSTGEISSVPGKYSHCMKGRREKV
jgi:hypothetical protein